MLAGAQMSAEQLNVESFHGLIEIGHANGVAAGLCGIAARQQAAVDPRLAGLAGGDDPVVHGAFPLLELPPE